MLVEVLRKALHSSPLPAERTTVIIVSKERAVFRPTSTAVDRGVPGLSWECQPNNNRMRTELPRLHIDVSYIGIRLDRSTACPLHLFTAFRYVRAYRTAPCT